MFLKLTSRNCHTKVVTLKASTNLSPLKLFAGTAGVTIRLRFFLRGCAASLSGNRVDEVKTIVVLTKFFLASRIFARRFSRKSF